MKVLAVNGSPRKKWNTATLLEHALEGAREHGAETSMVHLYDLDFKGCVSCFLCKKIGGKSYGRCAARDGLTPLLEEAAEADALILGSPIYLNTESGEMRSFLERLVFPYLTYTPERYSLAPKPLRVGLIYTMGVPEEMMAELQQDRSVASTTRYMNTVFGHCEVQLCTDTYQFDDYSKYLCTRFDPVAKAKRREEVFPEDCRKARELGGRLVQAAKAL